MSDERVRGDSTGTGTGQGGFDPGDAEGGLETIISRTLRVGVALALVLMGLGIMVGFVDGSLSGGPDDLERLVDPDAGASHTLSDAWGALVRLEGRGIMTAGLCVLLATPMVRVVVSLVGWARTGEWVYVALTSAVITALGVSILLGAVA